jgi:hypothetical protein
VAEHDGAKLEKPVAGAGLLILTSIEAIRKAIQTKRELEVEGISQEVIAALVGPLIERHSTFKNSPRISSNRTQLNLPFSMRGFSLQPSNSSRVMIMILTLV